MTRFIQLSDLHIVEPGRLAYGVVDTAHHLARAVAYIRSIAQRIGPIDAVIATGDLVDGGHPGEYARLRELLEPLEVPVLLLPGNHDERRALRDAFPDQHWPATDGALNRQVRVGGLEMLLMDSTVPGRPHGAFDDDTLRWLTDRVEALADRPLVIALHHPPFRTGIGHMDDQPLRDGEAFLRVMGSHGAPRLVICGHIHRYITCLHRDTPVTIGPSVAHAVHLDTRAGAPAEFSMEPGGFLLHEFDHEAGRFISQFVPVGPHQGPYPFFPGRVAT